MGAACEGGDVWGTVGNGGEKDGEGTISQRLAASEGTIAHGIHASSVGSCQQRSSSRLASTAQVPESRDLAYDRDGEDDRRQGGREAHVYATQNELGVISE